MTTGESEQESAGVVAGVAPPAEAAAKPARKHNPPPPGRRGGFGRQKGTPNKYTAEVKSAIKRFLFDPVYQNNLMFRIENGDANHMERYFWEVILGKPKTIIEVSSPAPTRALAEILRESLTKAERMQLAELTRKALTTVQARVVEQRALPAAVQEKA